MKYKKIDINNYLFGDGFYPYDWKESDNEIHICLKSERKQIVCPCCNQTTDVLHSNYHRKIQSIPLNGKKTFLDIVANKYDCTNEDCDFKVIVEPLPFAAWKQRRSIELDCLILAISCFMSDEGTSTILKSLGITISNDSIRRLREKLEFKDNTEVEMVGIDDVAIRKGQTYATSIYDMEDHHLIALLNGRDKDTLVSWLKEHPRIKLVSRDRASAYAAAINEVLPECVQVADRFHLLQNLIDHMKDIFKETIPTKIFIEDGKILEKEPSKIAAPIHIDDKILNNLNYDGSDPTDENGYIVEFNKSASDPNDPNHIKQDKNRKKKQELIREIQSKYSVEIKGDLKRISEKYSISQSTSKKYLLMSEEEINALDNPRKYMRKKKEWMNDFSNIIYKMTVDGHSPELIYAYILKKGYPGSENSLTGLIERILRNNFGIVLNKLWNIEFVYPRYDYCYQA